MPPISTPGELARRGELYHQLAQLTEAGLTLLQALEQLSRNPPSRSHRPALRHLSSEIARGMTFGEAVAGLREWLPAFDIALLTAAEQSGRLDAVFRMLSGYYADRARLWRKILGDLAYPAFLFHFAIFILPIPQAFASGNWLAYFIRIVSILIPLYVFLFVGIYLTQGTHGEKWRSAVERFCHILPLIGSARRKLALSRLAAALEALISAGVTIVEGWQLAASASGSPALIREVATWNPRLQQGCTPCELLRSGGVFPELFANLYCTGEMSGKLDDTLRRLHRLYQEEGTRQMHVVAQWVPRFLYLGVALMIAWQVIKFWTSYFQQIRDAGGF